MMAPRAASHRGGADFFCFCALCPWRRRLWQCAWDEEDVRPDGRLPADCSHAYPEVSSGLNGMNINADKTRVWANDLCAAAQPTPPATSLATSAALSRSEAFARPIENTSRVAGTSRVCGSSTAWRMDAS